jgi:hypothetical protein
MPIIVSCTCGRRLQVQEEYAGQRGQCPGCGHTFDLPGRAPADEAEFPAGASAGEDPAAGNDLLDEDEARAAAAPAPDSVEQQSAEPAPPPQQRFGSEVDLKEVRNHGGDALPRDIDFFAAAPPEIGPIFSAHSTLRAGVRPRPPGFRIGLGLFLGGVAVLAAVTLVALVDPRGPEAYIVWPLLAGLAAGGLAGLLTRFRHTCSYVGHEGVAHFRCAGDRGRITHRQVFLFRDAAEVRTSQVRHYVNGGYTGTNYTFTWTDVTGRVRFTWSGRHNSQQGNPKSIDPYHFGRSAEMAWSNYLLPGAFRQLDLSGTVLFLLTNGNWIRVGRNSLVLHFGGKEEEWDARDISAVSIDAGVIRIKRYGAKEGWFSSSGVFKFDFSSLGNAQLFFFLAQKVLGVSVG